MEGTRVPTVTVSLTTMMSVVTTAVGKTEGSPVSLDTPTPPTSADNKASVKKCGLFFSRLSVHAEREHGACCT